MLLGLVTRLPGPFYVRFIVACAVTAVYFLALNLLILPNPDVKDLMQSVIPAPCWRILREGKAGLYLFRLMPFSDALSLLWNRMRWAATEDPQRQALLNEKKHERVGRFLESVVGREPGMMKLVPKRMFDAAPIWVCWLQGMTYEEAAAALGITRQAVGSRLNRARRRLRDALEGSDEDDPA